MLRVEIRWIDSGTAYSDNQWEHREHIMKTATLHEMSTVGWLMGEDDFAYFVGLNYDSVSDKFFGAQVIAKSNVVSVTRLRARTLSTEDLYGPDQENNQENETRGPEWSAPSRMVSGLRSKNP